MFFTVIFVILLLAFVISLLSAWANKDKFNSVLTAICILLVTGLLSALSAYWTLKPNYVAVEMQYGNIRRIVYGEGPYFSSIFSVVYKGELSPTDRTVEFSIVTTDNRTYNVKAHATTVTSPAAAQDYLTSGLFKTDLGDIEARNVYFNTIDEAIKGTLLANMNKGDSIALARLNVTDLIPETQKALNDAFGRILRKENVAGFETVTSLKIISINEQPMVVIDDKTKK